MKNPKSKDEIELEIYNLTTGSKTKHEIECSKLILDQMTRSENLGTYVPLSIKLGKPSETSNIEDAIVDIKYIFLLDLKNKGLIKNFRTQQGSYEGYLTSYDFDLEADRQPLTNYLEKFIATNGGDKEVIWSDPDYGFYLNGDRSKYVRYTRKTGQAEKSYKTLIELSKNKGLSAGDLVKKVGFSKPNAVSNSCKRINEQFIKHCEVIDEVIMYDESSKKYHLNTKFIIKLAKETPTTP